VAPEDLEKRLSALLAEHEQSLNQRYSKEIEQLRSQLDDTRRRQEAAPVPTPRRDLPRREEPARARDPEPAPAGPAPAADPAAGSPQAAVEVATPAAAPAAAQEAAATETPLVAARLLQFDPPTYPLAARRQRVEGTVVLSVRIAADGRVVDVRFLRRVPQDVGINEAAAAAARQARFAPATRGGAAVESWYTLTIPFQL
jgi:protein TonB